MFLQTVEEAVVLNCGYIVNCRPNAAAEELFPTEFIITGTNAAVLDLLTVQPSCPTGHSVSLHSFKVACLKPADTLQSKTFHNLFDKRPRDSHHGSWCSPAGPSSSLQPPGRQRRSASERRNALTANQAVTPCDGWTG